MSWIQFLPALLKGAEVTAVIAVVSTLLGAAMAFIIGIARVEGGPILSRIALFYIEFMRGVPLLVKFFWLYYALPLIGLSLDPITTGIAGLVLNISAYGAEVVRGGLQSVPDQQHEAARALNFSKSYTLVHICLPQALVEMMPVLRQSRCPEPEGHGARFPDLDHGSHLPGPAAAQHHAQQHACLHADAHRLFRDGARARDGDAPDRTQAQARRGFPEGRARMIYGFAYDTSSTLAYALSILPILGIGLIVTIEAALVGFGIALVLGLVWCLLRRSRFTALSWTIAAIVEFIRDTPLLVQLFFLYYVLPDYGVTLPAFLTGALALGLQYSAYTSEVYRGGFDAVPRGQWEAATALNLTRYQVYRDIVVPQAIPRILPSMGNYAVSMLKETPVLSVVTVLDMLNLANMIGDRTFEYLVPLSLVGLIFPIMTTLCSFGIHALERALPKAGLALR